VGNAFALSKRSGISTALAGASILSMPARHTAIGIWLFIACENLNRAMNRDLRSRRFSGDYGGTYFMTQLSR
jgi:hypothetical protein